MIVAFLNQKGGVGKTTLALNLAGEWAVRGKRVTLIDAGHYVSHDGGPRLMRSVVYVRNTHGRAIHPTEKPSTLLEILIRTSCPEGGIVGDWFAGSGAAGEACRLSGRRYLGCEIDAAMAERARARIAHVLPFHERDAS